MSGGLVQDYSKSPIKQTPHNAPTQRTEIDKDASTPANLSTNTAAPPKLSYDQARTTMDPKSAPSRGDVGRQSFDQYPPRPMGQMHDNQILPVPNAPYTSPYGVSASNAGQQQQQQPQEGTLHATKSYDPSPQFLPSTQFAQTNPLQNQYQQQGYQQNPMHDGGITDYNENGESSLEYAGKAWNTASKTVSEYSSVAGEAAGNAWGSVKG